MLFWRERESIKLCGGDPTVLSTRGSWPDARSAGRVQLPPAARNLQQLVDLQRRQRLGDVFERDGVLHHLVKPLDLVELQHGLGIEAVAHSLCHGWRYLRVFRER